MAGLANLNDASNNLQELLLGDLCQAVLAALDRKLRFESIGSAQDFVHSLFTHPELSPIRWFPPETDELIAQILCTHLKVLSSISPSLWDMP